MQKSHAIEDRKSINKTTTIDKNDTVNDTVNNSMNDTMNDTENQTPNKEQNKIRNKIQHAFANGKAFIPFITCGDTSM